jgi:hypothetical protein
MVFDINTGYHPELSDFEYLFQTRYGIQGGTKFSFEVLPEIQFTRKNLLETIEEYPAAARALAFTARIAASYAMQYFKAPPSLSDFANIPLNHRLSLLYAYTESYGKHQDYNEAVHYNQCEKIAMENRHYMFTNRGIGMSNTILRGSDIISIKNGGTVPSASYVNPYNMDEYTDGFASAPPGSVKELKENLGKAG